MYGGETGNDGEDVRKKPVILYRITSFNFWQGFQLLTISQSMKLFQTIEHFVRANFVLSQGIYKNVLLGHVLPPPPKKNKKLVRAREDWNKQAFH